MCDSMHETAATLSVSMAAVGMCVCVFSKTMYLDRQRYTVFWPYTVCRPNTKTKISRTSGRPHRRSVFFFLHVAIRNSLRSNNTAYKQQAAAATRSDSPQSRGPCPRADPPSPRPSRSASEVARSRLRGLPHAPQSQPCFVTTTSLLYIYILLLHSPLPAGCLTFFPTRT